MRLPTKWLMCVAGACVLVLFMLTKTSVLTMTSHPSYDVIDNVIPSNEGLANMTYADLQALYHSYVTSPQVACNSVLRMGLITDGGWEHCDDPRYTPDPRSCLVYSYGINNDFSYDDDMAKFGCEVHSFDQSMHSGSHKRGTKVNFHQTGVAATDHVLSHMGNRLDETWTFYSIASSRRRLNHTAQQRRVDVVKMDVEGSELKSLISALDAGALDDVRQLNFESHVTTFKKENPPSKYEYIKFLELFRKVYEHGFRIYLTHRNPTATFFSGKKRVKCHEVHTVNINIINPDWKQRHQIQQQP